MHEDDKTHSKLIMLGYEHISFKECAVYAKKKTQEENRDKIRVYKDKLEVCKTGSEIITAYKYKFNTQLVVKSPNGRQTRIVITEKEIREFSNKTRYHDNEEFELIAKDAEKMMEIKLKSTGETLTYPIYKFNNMLGAHNKVADDTWLIGNNVINTKTGVTYGIFGETNIFLIDDLVCTDASDISYCSKYGHKEASHERRVLVDNYSVTSIIKDGRVYMIKQVVEDNEKFSVLAISDVASDEIINIQINKESKSRDLEYRLGKQLTADFIKRVNKGGNNKW